jgi:hypothetical protein
MHEKKDRMKTPKASIFKNIRDIEYFDFEEDFIEKNIRCIPMIVRFKMDKAGIKLKLAEWSQFSPGERIELATRPCSDQATIRHYRNYLGGLVKGHTGKDATGLLVEEYPAWADTKQLPEILFYKLKEYGWQISVEEWKRLSDLQRFALVKLCKPGHESKNFSKAVIEFNLADSELTYPREA